MAFLLPKKNKKSTTWYVGYYVDGKFIRKRIGKSKTLAKKARGEIEAKLELGEAGLIKKDLKLTQHFKEIIIRLMVIKHLIKCILPVALI